MKTDSENWRELLRTNGYVVFPGLVPNSLTDAANEAVKLDLRENYNPARKIEYDNTSFCPELRDKRVITDLLEKSPLWKILDEAIGCENIEHDRGQIAIREAHNVDKIHPPEPHIDGIPTPLNGVTGNKITNFTALAGIFLTAQPGEFAGNFTVWPGSHHRLENYFRERGRQAQEEGMPQIELGEPTQLVCSTGDAVLCHYQLAHTAAVNTCDVNRIAVYFRIWLRGLENRRWHYLTNIWDGWKI